MKYLLLLLLLSISHLLRAQTQSIKKWHADSLLTRDDFQGKPDPASSFHAASCCMISYNCKIIKTPQGNKPDFKVEALFNRSLAWMKGKMSDQTLRHENFHFAIEELNARILLKAFKAIRYSPSFKTEVEQAYALIRKKTDDMHHTYDEESYRSLNVAGQKRWEEYITQELANLPR